MTKECPVCGGDGSVRIRVKETVADVRCVRCDGRGTVPIPEAELEEAGQLRIC